MKRWFSLATAVLAVAVAGCRGLAWPEWARPGTAERQQIRAQQFDPYPENDSGPAMVGTRPMDYRSPPPEVQRARPDQLRQRWPRSTWARGDDVQAPLQYAPAVTESH